MSEPTIKPRLWCKECGEVDANHTGEFVQSFKHLHAVYEGFTHDDLVAVAREARESAWPKYADYGSGIDVEYTETPEFVVERLTGVKR